MITDRELLGLAAKAAGLEIVRWDRDVPMIYFDKLRPWNPLASKDQSKNLRHRLKLTTGFDDRFTDLGHCAYATYPTGPYSCDSVMQNIDDVGGSKNRATRRAIVRAAAEVGRAMT